MILPKRRNIISCDPEFNEFRKIYDNKFVEFVKSKCNEKQYYYIRSMCYDGNTIYISADSMFMSFFNDTQYIEYTRISQYSEELQFSKDVMKTNNVFKVISKDEYFDIFNKWIDHVRKSMTDFS